MKVKDLIAKLQEYDPEMDIMSQAVDCGGYDAIFTTDIAVYRIEIQKDRHGYNKWWTEKYEGHLYVGGTDEELV